MTRGRLPWIHDATPPPSRLRLPDAELAPARPPGLLLPARRLPRLRRRLPGRAQGPRPHLPPVPGDAGPVGARPAAGQDDRRAAAPRLRHAVAAAQAAGGGRSRPRASAAPRTSGRSPSTSPRPAPGCASAPCPSPARSSEPRGCRSRRSSPCRRPSDGSRPPWAGPSDRLRDPARPADRADRGGPRSSARRSVSRRNRMQELRTAERPMNRRRTPRSASAEDLLSTLQHLTARARQEVELHQARVELAQALQRKMLPATLPSFPGLADRGPLRARPRRAGHRRRLVRRVPAAGRLAGLAIGDVQGHDVEAAAFMGQIRIAMRAIASYGRRSGRGDGPHERPDPVRWTPVSSPPARSSGWIRVTRELRERPRRSCRVRLGHRRRAVGHHRGRRRPSAGHRSPPALPRHPARPGCRRCVRPAHRRGHRGALTADRRRAGADQASGELPRRRRRPTDLADDRAQGRGAHRSRGRCGGTRSAPRAPSPPDRR